jgi:hypothetical protein
MKRPGRILLNVYVGAFLAVTAVWIAGRLRRPADFPFPPPAPGWAVLWGRSAVHFRHWSPPVPNTQAADPYVKQAGVNSSGTTGRGSAGPAGLYAHSDGYYFARGVAYAFHGFALHYHVLWWATAPAAVLATAAYVRQRRRRQRAGTFCAVCGYDLRATPDRCPECGTIPAR